MNPAFNKISFSNLLAILGTEDSYSSDEQIARTTTPQISANLRNSAAGDQPKIINSGFYNNLPQEDSLSSDETIATIVLSKKDNAPVLNSTSPRLTSRSTAPAISTPADMTQRIENELIAASANKNQPHFEHLIFKKTADNVNLSKTDVPLIANTINWHLNFSTQHAPGTSITINKKLINRLLELGARVNTPDEKELRKSALWMALQQSDSEIVKMLLEYGCNPNSSRALTTAAKIGACNHMEILLKYGANPNEPQGGKYPLNEACLRGDIDMARLLLKSGAKVHEYGAKMTALMHAIISGNLELCTLLIQSGANAHYPTTEQCANFAFHLAEKYVNCTKEQFMACIDQLLQAAHGTQINTDAVGLSAFTLPDNQVSIDQKSDLEKQKFSLFASFFIFNKTCFTPGYTSLNQFEKITACSSHGKLKDTFVLEIAELYKKIRIKRNEMNAQ